jgi:hypothetical protein
MHEHVRGNGLSSCVVQKLVCASRVIIEDPRGRSKVFLRVLQKLLCFVGIGLDLSKAICGKEISDARLARPSTHR